MEVLGAVVSQAGAVAILSPVVAALSWWGGLSWERRKLARSERMDAYSSLRHSCSRWWAAIAEVRREYEDMAPEVDFDSPALDEVKRVSGENRDLAYSAYTQIEMVAPQEVVSAAFRYLTLHDAQYTNLRDGYVNISNQERNNVLKKFTDAAREDLNLKPISSGDLSSSRYIQIPKPRKADYTQYIKHPGGD